MKQQLFIPCPQHASKSVQHVCISPTHQFQSRLACALCFQKIIQTSHKDVVNEFVDFHSVINYNTQLQENASSVYQNPQRNAFFNDQYEELGQFYKFDLNEAMNRLQESLRTLLADLAKILSEYVETINNYRSQIDKANQILNTEIQYQSLLQVLMQQNPNLQDITVHLDEFIWNFQRPPSQQIIKQIEALKTSKKKCTQFQSQPFRSIFDKFQEVIDQFIDLIPKEEIKLKQEIVLNQSINKYQVETIQPKQVQGIGNFYYKQLLSTTLIKQEFLQQLQKKINEQQKITRDAQLIYKGSVEGFSVKQFWSKVLGLGPTLVILQTQTGLTIGGYNAVKFKDNGSQTDNTASSFVFSADNFKIYQIKQKEKLFAFYGGKETSNILFGFGFNGRGLQINKRFEVSSQLTEYDSDIPSLTGLCSITEMEIYYIC